MNNQLARAEKVVALRPPTHATGQGTLDLKNPFHQLQVERGLTSAWTDSLSDREMRVFQRIIRMTAGFGRLTHHFTVRQFVDGNGVFSGLHKDESNIRLALKGLEASGHITMAPDKTRGVTITINLKGFFKMLATPKRMQNQAEHEQEGSGEITRTLRAKSPDL